MAEPMDEIDQALFAILVEHDVAIAERNSQRTPQIWPDLSDIHTETRRRIREVFEQSSVRFFMTEAPD